MSVSIGSPFKHSFNQLCDEIKKRKPEFFHSKINKKPYVLEANFLFGDIFFEINYRLFDASLIITNHITKYVSVNHYNAIGEDSFSHDINKILKERDLFLERQSLSLSIPNVEVKKIKGKNKI